MTITQKKPVAVCKIAENMIKIVVYNLLVLNISLFIPFLDHKYGN